VHSLASFDPGSSRAHGGSRIRVERLPVVIPKYPEQPSEEHEDHRTDSVYLAVLDTAVKRQRRAA